MMSFPASILHGLYLCLAGIASLMVPMRQRAEWFREWRSELWHVRQACASGERRFFDVEREVAAFCFGAFQDAFCLRQHFWQSSPRLPIHKGSAVRCLFILCAVLLVACGVAVVLPGVRMVRQKQLFEIRQHLVLIHSARTDDEVVPTIGVDQFRLWARGRHQLFDRFSFYQVVTQSLPTAVHPKQTLTIAHASTNLFDLLGLSLRFTLPPEEMAKAPMVVLSDRLWNREFGADQSIAGRVIKVGERDVRVGGVAPAGFESLPGRAEAWLLEPDAGFYTDVQGFLVGHVVESESGSLWRENGRMTALKPDGSKGDFVCVSLNNRVQGPWAIYIFSVLLAFLALPATTSLPLGEYRFSTRHLSWTVRLRRWGFLSAKLGLLLLIAFFFSLDMAYGRATLHASSAEYIQLISTFSMCLFGLRWILRDQRQRCPVCLSRLRHPARVGQASQNFLAWNGTELICTGGHGLLHVPDLPTSWFSTQRWIYLDSSWNVLFPETAPVPSIYF
jgi:hypothetical protein